MAILATLAVLLLNPSGVVGRWVKAAYREWDEQRRVERTWDELVSVPSVLGSDMRSNRSAIVEFVDYDCPVCQSVAPAVSEATRTGGVSVVVRHVPSNRNGLGATEAALAAICAEPYGAFAQAHEALLSDPTWLETQDWLGFGGALGIAEADSFGNCIGEEATRKRLARDRELADYLQIPGTPTFVSSAALHPGATGLDSALKATTSASAPTYVREDALPARAPKGSIFDSSEHPHLEVSVIVAGLFLPDSGMVLVDRTELHVIDLLSGTTRVVGRKGEGPKEFGHIALAHRTPHGILVWDFLRRRAVEISPAGELLRSQDYVAVSFTDLFNAYPVGVHPDGRVMFRDGVQRNLGEYEGRTWNPATYVAVRDDGNLDTVAVASGDEVYYRPKRSGDVVFGNRTLEAVAGEHLIIADTKRESIAVLDWSGGRVAEVPMTPGLRLTAAQVQAGREARIAALRRVVDGMKSRAAATGRGLVRDLDRFYDPQEMGDWPANEVAPAIDTVLTDYDARLWVRDYRLPDQDSVTWQVWDIDEAELLFTARMDGKDTLLDARGDLVLLRRVDEFDVPRAVIKQLADMVP